MSTDTDANLETLFGPGDTSHAEPITPQPEASPAPQVQDAQPIPQVETPPAAPAVDQQPPAAQEAQPHMVPLACLLYTSPSPRDGLLSRMPSSA